jgi:uncharacterized protein HemX
MRWLDSRQADRAGKLLAVVALTASLILGYAVYQQNRCQAAYAVASNASSQGRAEAAEKDRQAQDLLFRAIANSPRTADQLAAAVQRFPGCGRRAACAEPGSAAAVVEVWLKLAPGAAG